MISFGLQGSNSGLCIYFEYNRIEHKCYLVYKNARSESIDLVIKDGDTIGVIYIDETNEYGITLNGNLQGKETATCYLHDTNALHSLRSS